MYLSSSNIVYLILRIFKENLLSAEPTEKPVVHNE